MKAPEFAQSEFDETDFDGAPVSYWRNYVRRYGNISSEISKAAKPILAAAVPDESLHKHVARVSVSHKEGHTTLLTTAGHIIQFQAARPAQDGRKPTQGAVIADRKLDKAGVSIIMAHYARKGFNLTAEQIPFTKAWGEDEKDRIRKLWSEVQQKQKHQHQAAPNAEPIGRKPHAARQPAYA